VLDYVSDCITLRDVPADVTKATLLKDGSSLNAARHGDTVVITIPPERRDGADTVISLER
jgi:hypothetical protein